MAAPCGSHYCEFRLGRTSKPTAASMRSRIRYTRMPETARLSQVNLLEDETGLLTAEGGQLVLPFRAYVVKTIKITHGASAQEE
jgi:hypothetical protein